MHVWCGHFSLISTISLTLGWRPKVPKNKKNKNKKKQKYQKVPSKVFHYRSFSSHRNCEDFFFFPIMTKNIPLFFELIYLFN